MRKINILPGLKALVLLCALSFAPHVAAAPPFAPEDVPDPLKPWIDWVLRDQEKALCPFFDGDQGRTSCAWPSALDLSLNETSGTFVQGWRLHSDGWVRLPGDEDHWPLDVSVDGKAGAVVLMDGVPQIHLRKGEHSIRGNFAWDSLPESFAIPTETAALGLRVKGIEVSRPNLTEDGLLWIQSKAQTDVAEDSLDVRLHRQMDDDIPFVLTTSLDMDVAGKTREAVFAPLLPDGFVPMALESPLPARLEADGRLKVQVRSGQWKVQLKARHEGPVAEIKAPGTVTEENQRQRRVEGEAPTASPMEGATRAPVNEIWTFVPHNDLRLVSVEGVTAVDPQQTTLPDEWKRLAAYAVRRGDTVRLVERRRGDAEGDPDQLTLNRQIWLDFDGRGYTLQDRIGGTFSRGTRLEMNPPVRPGRIAVNGPGGSQDQLITKTPGSEGSGIEVRRGPADLSADSRIDGRRFRLPAIGWNRDFQNVSGTLHLPPGWRAFAVWGADHVPNTWVNRWTLLDIFLVLVLALSFAKMWSPLWGALALATFTLTFPEHDAPVWIWLAVVAGEALIRLLPAGFKGRIRIPLKLYRLGTLVLLLAIAVPFVVFSLRQALYPSLEQPHVPTRFAAGGEFAGNIPPPPAAAPAAPFPKMEMEDLAVQEQVQHPAAEAPQAMRMDKKMKASILSRSAVSKQNLQQIPGAQVQTGPGLPRWSWHSVPLQWSGPVAQEQSLRFLLLGPFSNFVLAVLRVFLLALLILRVLEVGGFWPSFLKRKHLAAGLLALLCLAGPSQARADFPNQDLLNQLRDRLVQKPECVPHCAAISRMRVEATPGLLRMRLEVAAQAATAVPLPANPRDWMPRRVSVDGGGFAGVRLEGGQAWVELAPGVHQVVIEGPIADRPSIQIPLPMKPHRVETGLIGWTLEGLHEDGQADDNLQLTRTQPLQDADAGKDAASTASNNLPPFLRVERRLSLGLTWSVETRVVRLSPPGSSVVIEVPLLAGESVTSDGIRVQGGKALVSLPPQAAEFSWNSVIQPVDLVDLKAPDQGPWIETWILEASPIWHVDPVGIPQVPSPEEGVLLWRPWPGEGVTLKVSRPEGVPGQTVTIDRSLLALSPGLRFTEATLTLDIRSSLGGQHAITLPEGAELQSVWIDGSIQPVRPVDGRLTLPLAPGSHGFAIKWQQPGGVRFFFRAPRVDLGVPSVNSDVQVQFPERWILLVGGPRLGPAILFWSLLIVMVLVAVGLSRTGLTPLSTFHWVLLSLGLTQTPIWASMIFAGWFLALGWRQKNPRTNPYTFDLLQVTLVIWTVTAVGILFASIHQGLLGRPDMQVAGNGSSGLFLKWFQDRSDGPLPRPWALSLPLFWYRIAMLGWALWVAWAFLSWLKWGWRAFAKGGTWKQARLVRRTHEKA